MNQHTITELRLANQYIVGSGHTPLAVVEHMGAMQAQDYNGALWSLGLRTGLTQKEIVSFIEKRKIVRTWPQRGTLHFVVAQDAKWQVSLSAERLIRGVATRHERLGINEKILQKSKTILTKALQGGKILSRAKIMEALEKEGISTTDGRGYHTLWYLSQTGVLVAGPMDEKQQTFTLLDEWVKNPKTKTREAGIAELVKRYFTSHGPATLQDFMWWSGITAKEAKAGLESHGSLFVSEKFEGKEYWMKKNLKLLRSTARAFLLPGFDEYMLGYKDRSAALPAAYAKKIVPGGNGMFLSTIVLDGQVVGTWKKDIKKNGVHITLHPFQILTKTQVKLLEVPASHYGNFLGVPWKLK